MKRNSTLTALTQYAATRIIISSTLLLGFYGPVFAQPDSLWSKTFGGQYPDRCFDMIQTADGGFAMAGYSYSITGAWHDPTHAWLVRTDENGDSLWTHDYGPGSFVSLIQTPDGGFALAGQDFRLVRADENGETLWSQIYDVGGWGGFTSITRTIDGGFAMAGRLVVPGGEEADEADYGLLVRTDENGAHLWSRTFGGGGNNDVCASVIQTSDGGFVIAGQTNSFGAGSADVWLIRTNENGNQLWSRTYGGADYDAGTSVIQTADGGFTLAGQTFSFGAGNGDMWLVRTNENGDSLWSRTFGGDGGGDGDGCLSIISTAYGGFALAGVTSSVGAGNNDFWLVWTDSGGDSLASRTFGGPNIDNCWSVVQTMDGGFVLGGESESFGAGMRDFWLVRTGAVWVPKAVLLERICEHVNTLLGAGIFNDGQASSLCVKIRNTIRHLAHNQPDAAILMLEAFKNEVNAYIGNVLTEAQGRSLINEANFIIALIAEFGTAGFDGHLVQTWADLPTEIYLSDGFPNPFNATMHITFGLPEASHANVCVFDMAGRLIAILAEGEFTAGNYAVIWNADTAPAGIYIVKMEAGNFNEVRKLTLVR